MRVFCRSLQSLLRGVLVAFCVLCSATIQAGAQEIEAPLRPTETTSPRATLFSFIRVLEDAYSAGERGNTDLSARLVERAMRYVDLSALPTRTQRYKADEVTLLLKEVIDRIELPSPDAVPGRVEATGQQRETGILVGGLSEDDAPPITLWQVPGSNIRIHRVEEGSREGEYLFSPQTMGRVAIWYENIKDQPYQSRATPNIYDGYARTPGRGINLRLNEAMPDWLMVTAYGQTVWQIISLVLVLIVLAFALQRVSQWGRKLDERIASHPVNDESHNWRPGRLFAAALVSFALFWTTDFIDVVLSITGQTMAWVATPLTILGYVYLGIFAFTAVGQLFELLIRGRKLSPNSANAQLIRLVGYLVGAALIAAVFVVAAEDFGLPAATMLAGFGVGGIAVSLAARETLTDLIGSFVIMAEGPYKLNDYVTIGQHTGTVIAIGMRSTKLRTTDNLVVSIPHSQISSNAVENYDFRISRLINTSFRIDDSTSLEKLETFLGKVHQSLMENPSVRDEPCLVQLQTIGPGHLEILLYFYLNTPAWSDFVRERAKIMAFILQCAEETSVALAPTQTIDATTATSSANKDATAAQS